MSTLSSISVALLTRHCEREARRTQYAERTAFALVALTSFGGCFDVRNYVSSRKDSNRLRRFIKFICAQRRAQNKFYKMTRRLCGVAVHPTRIAPKEARPRNWTASGPPPALPKFLSAALRSRLTRKLSRSDSLTLRFTRIFKIEINIYRSLCSTINIDTRF